MIAAHERMAVYSKLRDSVKAFIFLAVPHRGSDHAFWLKYLVDLSKILGLSGNTNFVDALRANSETLTAISTQSVERIQSDKISIKTFFETDRIRNLMVC